MSGLESGQGISPKTKLIGIPNKILIFSAYRNGPPTPTVEKFPKGLGEKDRGQRIRILLKLRAKKVDIFRIG